MPAPRWTSSCAALALLALGAAGKAEASFSGNQVTADYRFPDAATVDESYGTATVGAGVEFPSVAGFGQFSLNISDNTIVYRNNFVPNANCPACGTTIFAQVAFVGFLLTNLSQAWPAFSVTQAVSGFTAAGITVNGNELFLNLRGAEFPPGSFIELTAVATAVPAPPALALMIAGLVGIGLSARRSAA